MAMSLVVIMEVGKRCSNNVVVPLFENFRNLFNSSLLPENTGMNEVRLIGVTGLQRFWIPQVDTQLTKLSPFLRRSNYGSRPIWFQHCNFVASQHNNNIYPQFKLLLYYHYWVFTVSISKMLGHFKTF